MKELRTISKCDHNIHTVDIQGLDFTCPPYTNGSVVKYILPGNYACKHVNEVHIITDKGDKRLFNCFDYILRNDEIVLVSPLTFFTSSEMSISAGNQEFQILRTSTGSHVNNFGKIKFDGLFAISAYAEYTLQTCPRCGASGWYVDIFEEGRSGDISDGSKLTQQVIKCLFTDENSDGYGTQLKSLVGKSFATEDAFCRAFANEVTKCEEQIQSIQDAFISDGGQLQDSERLASIQIASLSYAVQEGLYQVSLDITAADDTVTEAKTTF